MILQLPESREIKGPVFKGFFSISSFNPDNALKIFSGNGRDENLLANHNTGFNNIICKIFLIMRIGSRNYKWVTPQKVIRVLLPATNHFTAIILISTFTNFGSAETCTVSLAGKLSPKYFP